MVSGAVRLGTAHPSLVDEDAWIDLAYRFVLGRPADDAGRENYRHHLTAGTRTRESMLDELRGSDEFWFHRALAHPDPAFAIHRSRCLFVQTFPRARRILDLGGSHQQHPEGALVHLGYPYPFEELVIVELPPEDRHELYRAGGAEGTVPSRLGPVRYRYHSMADLSAYGDGSFDLVYSGQTIEHVPTDVGRRVLAEAHRVLRSGGWLCLDTPNGRMCRLQLEGTGLTVTNPDHDVEYDHAEIAAMITGAGFEIRECWGLLHLPRTAASGRFVHDEFGRHIGMFRAVEDCYLLAYVARRP